MEPNGKASVSKSQNTSEKPATETRTRRDTPDPREEKDEDDLNFDQAFDAMRRPTLPDAKRALSPIPPKPSDAEASKPLPPLREPTAHAPVAPTRVLIRGPAFTQEPRIAAVPEPWEPASRRLQPPERPTIPDIPVQKRRMAQNSLPKSDIRLPPKDAVADGEAPANFSLEIVNVQFVAQCDHGVPVRECRECMAASKHSLIDASSIEERKARKRRTSKRPPK